MFLLFKTIDDGAGRLETQLHGSYSRRGDAEQIGENLRLLYPWIKGIRVSEEDEAAASPLALSRKKMAGSIPPASEQQPRKIS